MICTNKNQCGAKKGVKCTAQPLGYCSHQKEDYVEKKETTSREREKGFIQCFGGGCPAVEILRKQVGPGQRQEFY
jgi:hypothetical protein